MRIYCLFFLVLFYPALVAMTWHEATSYGSNILICKDDVVVKYWSLFQRDNASRIMDDFTKKTYPLKDCELFKCSSDPARRTLCVLPDKGKQK